MSAPFNVLRLSEDSAGESHFDNYDIAFAMTDFAPPAAPFLVSPAENCSRYVVLRLDAGWAGERHCSPNRQILFCLSGQLRVTASDGDVRSIKTGDAWLMQDTSGRGHHTEVISKEAVTAIVIVLADPS